MEKVYNREKTKKVILITGASRGIGAAIAEKFGEAGYCVAINYNQSKKDAENVADQVRKKGGTAALFQCDISDFESAKNMVRSVAATFGKIDVLVNNAGIAIDKPLDKRTAVDFEKTLNINLIAPFVISTEAAKFMGAGSSIINISSTNAFQLNCFSCDYDASKAGLNTLTKNLASFYQPNIRVNSVSPGWIDTDMNKGIDRKMMADNFTGRIGKPEEVASAVFFLASDEAKFINAADIVIDGGV